MKAAVIFALFVCVFVSCSAGPIFVAKDESEGIKTSYEDPALSELATRYRPLLNDVYRRYQSAGIGIYPGGIGFTTVSTDEGRKLHYLLVQVRPRNIMFGEVQTKPRERFGQVFERHFENNLRYLKADDVRKDGIDGLAFGVYWPVRDLSQCDTYGGFLEYTIIYFHKDDFLNFIEKRTTFSEAVDNAEVVMSLDRKAAKSVKVKEVK
jgi:hypothetical protein